MRRWLVVLALLLSGCAWSLPRLPAAPAATAAGGAATFPALPGVAMPAVSTVAPGASGAQVAPAPSHGQAQTQVIRSWLDWSDLTLTLAAVAAVILAVWWRSPALGTLALALGAGAAGCALLAWLAPIRHWLFLGAGVVTTGVLWYRHREARTVGSPVGGFVRHALRVLGPGRAAAVPSHPGLARPVLFPGEAQADAPAAVAIPADPKPAASGREYDHGPPAVV